MLVLMLVELVEADEDRAETDEEEANRDNEDDQLSKGKCISLSVSRLPLHTCPSVSGSEH